MKVLFLILISLFFVAYSGDIKNNGSINMLQESISDSVNLENKSLYKRDEGQNITKQNVNSNQTTNEKNQKVLDNMGNPVRKEFNGFVLELRSNKVLSEDLSYSKESIVVYGLINGENTNALLKINENYRDSVLTLLIYKNNELVYTKENIKVINQVAVDFGNIIIKEKSPSIKKTIQNSNIIPIIVSILL